VGHQVKLRKTNSLTRGSQVRNTATRNRKPPRGHFAKRLILPKRRQLSQVFTASAPSWTSPFLPQTQETPTKTPTKQEHDAGPVLTTSSWWCYRQ
jgi:hypothetical protein